MSEPLLVFNGVNGATGGYGLPPMTGAQLSKFITGEAKPGNLSDLQRRHRDDTVNFMGPRAGLDPKKLDEVGWGVIFAHDVDPEIKEALSELLKLREKQAGAVFHVFEGPKAYRPGESKSEFLARHKMGAGPADPTKVPYYLLIVGSPEAIPYDVQYELDVQYAVGRIHFETLDEYARYGRSVVTAEQGKIKPPRQVSFFGVSNPDDGATQMSTDFLIEPLYKRLKSGKGGKGTKGWEAVAALRDEATKSRLSELLGGPQTPPLLVTGSHGLEFPLGDPRQVPHQGALLCQDWPGPEAWRGKGAIPQDHYFAGDDLAADANLTGMLAFFFACYGGGTPLNDEFSRQAFKERTAIAPHPFIAGLPTRMLGHPRGGALAVIGHVERAWSYSYHWPDAGAQTIVFEDALDLLLGGTPVGAAMEEFGVRWADLATGLNKELSDIEFGKKYDPYKLAEKWTANNDARSYVIVGDPAVRLSVAGPGEKAVTERPVIDVRYVKGQGSTSSGGPGALSPKSAPSKAKAEDSPSLGASSLSLDATGRSDAEPAGAAEPMLSLAGVDEDLLTLTVSTYAAADVSQPAEDELKFRTTISLVGDVETALPAQVTDEDAPYLEWHQEMVKAAWQGRLEVLRLAAQTGQRPPE